MLENALLLFKKIKKCLLFLPRVFQCLYHCTVVVVVVAVKLLLIKGRRIKKLIVMLQIKLLFYFVVCIFQLISSKKMCITVQLCLIGTLIDYVIRNVSPTVPVFFLSTKQHRTLNASSLANPTCEKNTVQ